MNYYILNTRLIIFNLFIYISIYHCWSFYYLLVDGIFIPKNYQRVVHILIEILIIMFISSLSTSSSASWIFLLKFETNSGSIFSQFAMKLFGKDRIYIDIIQNEIMLKCKICILFYDKIYISYIVIIIWILFARETLTVPFLLPVFILNYEISRSIC